MPPSKDKSKGKNRKIRHKGHKKMLVPKWKLFRAKEPLISVFMWGVNHTVSVCIKKSEVWKKSEKLDFSKKKKSEKKISKNTIFTKKKKSEEIQTFEKTEKIHFLKEIRTFEKSEKILFFQEIRRNPNF